MSKYTDMYVHTSTRDRLKRFADERQITLAELLDHIAYGLERNAAKSAAQLEDKQDGTT